MDNNKRDKIFVVDDKLENIKILGNLLEKNRYEPMVFLSARTALETLKDIKPELFLLDIMMPEMNGYEMCELLKSDNSCKNIPVIFLTGRTETEDLVKGFKVGAADYVKKPFNFDELLARIETHINLKKANDKIKTLSGLLPICGHCKKIRDDKGYWNQIESYIQENSEAIFSHSICQDCAKEYYPDYDIYEE